MRVRELSINSNCRAEPTKSPSASSGLKNPLNKNRSHQMERAVAKKVLKRLAILAAAGGAGWWLFLRKNKKNENLPRVTEAPGKGRKDVGLNKEFVGQLVKLLPVLFPGFRDKTTALMAAHTTCLVARTFASIYLASMDGKIAKALITGNGRRFLGLLAVWLFSAVPIAFVNAGIKFLKNQLAQAFRDRLTRKAHDQYMHGLTYYQIEQLDGRLQNVDGCITRDIEKFSSALADLYSSVAKPMLDVSIFQAQLAYNVGFVGLTSITALIHTGTLALRYFTPPFGRLTEAQQTLEGNFRFVHSRIITNAEEIAFYNGQAGAPVEKSYLDTAYAELRSHSIVLNLAQLRFGIMEEYIVKYFWGALGFLICALPVFTPFGKPPVGVSDGIADRTGAFFTNRRILLNTSDAFGRLMSSWRKVNELTGYTSRVSQMFTVFSDMEAARFQHNFKPKPLDAVAEAAREPFVSEGTMEEGEIIEVRDLAVVSPTGDVLAEHMTFELPRGAHLFVSGPNGCGKTSLFRVVAGLWPVVRGHIVKPRGAIFFVPQRPYLSLGTLRDQLTYPMGVEEVRRRGISDADLLAIVEQVKLARVVEAHGGLDAVKNWKDTLSGGEKQRTAMARLFFHKPAYAILDESTSACQIDVEQQMYSEAKRLGISLITVSHRHTLWKFHDYLLTMDGRGSWTFQPMEHASVGKDETVQSLSLREEKRDLEKRLKEVEQLLQ